MKISNLKFKISNKSGFTMVETLVAITILATAVIGSSYAVQTAINSHILSKDEIVAFYLAQEGVEQIRNLRDENSLNGRNWLSGIAQNGSDPCYFGKTCRVDVTSNPMEIADCGEECPPLRQDAGTGFFGYNAGWTATNYTRSIELTSVNADEVSILVTISWSKGSDGSATQTFRVKENILNWQ